MIFQQPLAVEEGEQRRVFTILEKKGESYLFRIVSHFRAEDGGNDQWQEHATGEIAPAENIQMRSRTEVANLLAGMQRTAAHNGNGSAGLAHEKFIVTGPRWEVLQEVYLHKKQAVGILELGHGLEEDLSTYRLHPAMLDVATGFAHFLTQGDFLPLTYDRITCFAPIPGRAITHVRMRTDPDGGQDVLTSDISILDESGLEVVEIKNFSMKRVSKESLARLEAAKIETPPKTSIEQIFQHQLTPGLSTHEGATLFKRLLRQGRSPQIIISTRDLKEVLHDTLTMNGPKLLAELQGVASEASMHARPELGNAFSAPTDEIEQRIAAVWQRVLGVERVGIYDNFFELGGTSLNGIQVAAELKKELNVELPTVTIFEAPTVAALAKYLQPDAGQKQFQQVQGRAEKKKQALGVNQRQRARAGAASER